MANSQLILRGISSRAHLTASFEAATDVSYRGYIDSNKVAIVCSARSGSTKALGTTNLLLRAASETLKRPNARSGYTTPVSNGIFGRTEDGSLSPPLSSPRGPEAYPWASGMSPLSNADELPEFHATVDLIRQEHFNAARASVQDAGILQELEAEIERDCEWLRSFLYASQVCGGIVWIRMNGSSCLWVAGH